MDYLIHPQMYYFLIVCVINFIKNPIKYNLENKIIIINILNNLYNIKLKNHLFQ